MECLRRALQRTTLLRPEISVHPDRRQQEYKAHGSDIRSCMCIDAYLLHTGFFQYVGLLDCCRFSPFFRGGVDSSSVVVVDLSALVGWIRHNQPINPRSELLAHGLRKYKPSHRPSRAGRPSTCLIIRPGPLQRSRGTHVGIGRGLAWVRSRSTRG